MPRLKKNQEIVGFRPHGNTDILAKPRNFNFELRRQKDEKTKNRSVIAMVLLSFIPFAMFVANAESNFRKTQIK
jgi:hypothetical protein